MRFLFALIIFFYTAFDSCLIEAVEHEVADPITIVSTINHDGCSDSEDSHGTTAAHQNDVCHTCQNCHNWITSGLGFNADLSAVKILENYSFFLPNPEIQKIERPPIHS